VKRSSLEYYPSLIGNDYDLQARVLLDVAYEDENDEYSWRVPLAAHLKNALRDSQEFESDDIVEMAFDPAEFFVNLSQRYKASVSINQSVESIPPSINIRLLPRNTGAHAAGIRDNSPLMPQDNRYDVLKKLIVIWAHAHDAIHTSQMLDVPSNRKRLQVIPPSAEIYMPATERKRETRFTLDDIAGYDSVKEKLMNMALVYNNPEIAKNIGLESSGGILLHGTPGTGKTTMAHGLAGEVGARMVELSASHVVDKWVGSSSRTLDNFFAELTQTSEKIVLLMDEFDTLGVKPNLAGSTERADVVNRLKVHIDDVFLNHPNILVVGTSNNIERIDESLLRSGRLQPIEVLPPNESDRLKIINLKLGKAALLAFSNYLRNRNLPVLDVETIDEAKLALESDGLVGADFEEILESIRRQHLREYVKSTDYNKQMLPITHDELLERIRAMRISKDI